MLAAADPGRLGPWRAREDSVMRKSPLLFCLVAALLAADLALPDEHLVSPQQVQARLAEAAAARQDRLALVRGVLSSPQAVSMAAALGADLDTVRAAAAILTDAELADLAERAAAVDRDPVAGLDQDIKLLVVILLIALIVVVILSAVD